MSGPQVVLLLPHPVEPFRLAGAEEECFRLLGEAEEVRTMSSAQVAQIRVVHCLVEREGAYRLQQAVPAAVSSVLALHHRLLDQTRQQVPDPFAVQRLIATDLLRRVQAETSCEHREPVENRPLLRTQQYIAPVNGRAQCLLPWEGRPSTSGQQPETIVESLLDFAGTHRSHASGGELDG